MFENQFYNFDSGNIIFHHVAAKSRTQHVHGLEATFWVVAKSIQTQSIYTSEWPQMTVYILYKFLGPSSIIINDKSSYIWLYEVGLEAICYRNIHKEISMPKASCEL